MLCSASVLINGFERQRFRVVLVAPLCVSTVI